MHAMQDIPLDEALRSLDRSVPFLPVGDEKPATSVALIKASTICPKAIRWLWDGFLAKGKLHILAGKPGTGKTTLALHLAAQVTIGGSWPDSSRCPAGNVIIWSGEDNPEDTLVPRILAAGADASRFLFVGDASEGGKPRAFDPARDMTALADAIRSAGGASLLIVDPIVSAVAADTHKSGEVRRSLQPLVDLAANLDCAILGISHFSKGTAGSDPLERVTGSIAFGAMARVVFATAKEEMDEEGGVPKRLFIRAKSNIGPDGGGFEYSLNSSAVPAHPGMFASTATFGAVIEGDARSVLNRAEGDASSSAGDHARDFLIDTLAGGPVGVKAIRKLATEAGLSWRTVERAKKALGVVARKSASDGGWEWQMGEGRQDRQEIEPWKVGGLGGLEPQSEHAEVTI